MHLKLYQQFYLILIVWGCALVYWIDNRDYFSTIVSKSISPEKLGNEMECKLPILNPFSASIQKYNVDVKPYNCYDHLEYPLLFTTDLRSTLIQIDEPAKYGYYSCCYRPFKRKKKSDTRVVFSKECTPILDEKTSISPDTEFIEISCSNNSLANSSSMFLVVDLIGFVHSKNINEDKINAFNTNWPTNSTNSAVVLDTHKISSKRPPNISFSKLPPDSSSDKNKTGEAAVTRKVNVVIFGVDGVSHMNFMRAMPRSYDFLTKNLSGLGLWGYTKVGENTFLNIVPVLTGLFVQELKTVGHCWYNTWAKFDRCPFLWKNFSQQGYTTSYGEDAVWMGIFRYTRRGFRNQPTNHYLNTLTHQQRKTLSHGPPGHSDICYGPRLGFQVLLDHLKQMAVAMATQNRPYFQFLWATSLTHDDLNMGKLGDLFLLDTLEWLQTSGTFKNTVFILMSDHGIRFGPIRSTIQGHFEERMPFAYFVFPQWFREQYGSAVSNIISNKMRLTTPFDLHETLKDLLLLENIKSHKIRERRLNLNKNKTLPRGISLFLPIPVQRRCQEAQIRDHWCVCQEGKSFGDGFNNGSGSGIEAAVQIVYFINEMLAKFPQCLSLGLQKVLTAEEIQRQSSSKETVTVIRLSFTVTPSNASFETTATRSMDGQLVVHASDISRTNAYEGQSYCVPETEFQNLKKFCYCRDL